MKLAEYIQTKERELSILKHLTRITKEEFEIKQYIQTYMLLSIAKNNKYHNVPTIRFLINEGVSHTEFLDIDSNGVYSIELCSDNIEEHKTYANLNVIDKIALFNIDNLNQEITIEDIYSKVLETTEIKNFTYENSIYRELAIEDLLYFDIDPYAKHKYINTIISKSYYITEISNRLFYFLDDKVVIDNQQQLKEYNYGSVIEINNTPITLTEDGLKLLEMFYI